MGYTHYWEKTKKTKPSTWKKFTTFVENLLTYKVNGQKVDNTAGGTCEVAVIKNGLGVDEPVITDDEVLFNGDASQGLDHETFGIERCDTSGFDFCKTDRKPYDPVVVACLIEAERLGIIDEWRSDGDASDHEGGVKLHEAVSN